MSSGLVVTREFDSLTCFLLTYIMETWVLRYPCTAIVSFRSFLLPAGWCALWHAHFEPIRRACHVEHISRRSVGIVSTYKLQVSCPEQACLVTREFDSLTCF
jgi:hypothetical protein